MTNTRKLLGAAVVAISAAAALLAWAAEGKHKEQKVTLEQVPPAVREALTRMAGSATITEIEKEVKNGVEVYEAEWMVNGVEHEVTVTAEGKLIKEKEEKEEEEVIALEQVPDPAREALLKLAGSAKIAKVEKEKENGTIVYEAEWIVEGRKHGAAVTAEGALVETEETVEGKDVPEAVRKAAEKRFPTATKLIFEKETKVEYEVTAIVDGKKHEVELTPAGRVADAEDEGDEDRDDDKDEGVKK